MCLVCKLCQVGRENIVVESLRGYSINKSRFGYIVNLNSAIKCILLTNLNPDSD